MRRALVLGGGGSVGLAWEAAILGGLSDAGFDGRTADAIIGTSAGSVVGACVGHAADPREVLRARAARGAGGGPSLAPNPDDVAAVFRVWGGSPTMTQADCAEAGRLAMAARTISQQQWLEGFAAYGWPGWPKTPLLVMTVDCHDGTVRAWSTTDGVPLEVATAASCAVPGFAPTVTIGSRQYMDGGVGSWTSADFALRVQPERVLIVAPAGVEGGGTRGLAARQVVAETTILEAAGSAVRLITFDEDAGRAGKNLMDAAAIPAVIAAGDAHARRIADEIYGWWAA